MCVDTCLTYQSLVPQSDWPFHALTNNNGQKKTVSFPFSVKPVRPVPSSVCRPRAWFSIVLLYFLPRFIHLGWVVLSLHLIHPITITRGSEKKGEPKYHPVSPKTALQGRSCYFPLPFFGGLFYRIILSCRRRRRAISSALLRQRANWLESFHLPDCRNSSRRINRSETGEKKGAHIRSHPVGRKYEDGQFADP